MGEGKSSSSTTSVITVGLRICDTNIKNAKTWKIGSLLSSVLFCVLNTFFLAILFRDL